MNFSFFSNNPTFGLIQYIFFEITLLNSLKTIVYFLSHIPTKDLYYVISIMKDKKARGESASAYLLGSIKSNGTN